MLFSNTKSKISFGKEKGNKEKLNFIKRISKYDSENAMYCLLKKNLESPEYLQFDINVPRHVTHCFTI